MREDERHKFRRHYWKVRKIVDRKTSIDAGSLTLSCQEKNPAGGSSMPG